MGNRIKILNVAFCSSVNKSDIGSCPLKLTRNSCSSQPKNLTKVKNRFAVIYFIILV